MNQIIQKEKIENLIYEIRGKQVMLDSDLARLYNIMTGNLNKAVKRNIERFPEDFMFQLARDEYDTLMFQIGISKSRGGNRKLPYVFTEQGVSMLSSVLKTDIAAKMSVNIMRAFVTMKKYISTSIMEQKYINNLVMEHEERLKIVENTFANFKEKNNHIFFEGQIYDAYSLLLDIFEKAKNEIIIIDNYIDKNLLDILSKTKKKVTIVTNMYNNHDYTKYKKQYKNVELKINNTFHDRFIIIDKKILYHCGASFKDLGKRCFAISKLEDYEYLNKLLKNIDLLNFTC